MSDEEDILPIPEKCPHCDIDMELVAFHPNSVCYMGGHIFASTAHISAGSVHRELRRLAKQLEFIQDENKMLKEQLSYYTSRVE